MKGQYKFLFFALAFFLAGIQAGFSQGYIVPNGVVDGGYQQGAGYEMEVLHDPNNPVPDSYTGFFLSTLGPPIFQFMPDVDVGVRVFEVSPNAPIAAATIQAGDYTELLFGNNYVLPINTPYYLAFYTGNENFSPPNGIYTDPIFGWAELENTVNGSIQLLSSALEYQGAGIYAGTQTIIQPVPEPDEFALVALGALLFASVKRFLPPAGK